MEPTSPGDCDWTETDRGDARFRRAKLGAAAGGDQLGCSLYELPAGGKSWPYHYHTGNEEAVYVLAGAGTLRAPDGEHAIEAGDYAAFPADESGAHRVVNDGDEPLRYLMLSTMADPDITVYPDSGKVHTFAGAPPGSEGERRLDETYRREDATGYWE
ncbi:MAG: cupin domain-containing protein [Halobacteriaceae archaeon]